MYYIHFRLLGTTKIGTREYDKCTPNKNPERERNQFK